MHGALFDHRSVNTPIAVLWSLDGRSTFALDEIESGMTTVGTKYARRMRDDSAEKVIDARVKKVIRALLQRVSGPIQVLAVRKHTALFMLVVLLTSASRAAEQAVTGTVMDVDSVPLAFVNVQVEGTARGTMTDVHGRFRLEHLSEGTVQLVFSFIGYEMRSITVGPDHRDRPIVVLLTERVIDLPVFTIQNSMTGGFRSFAQTARVRLVRVAEGT